MPGSALRDHQCILRGTYGMLGRGPRLAMCKENTIPAVGSLLKVYRRHNFRNLTYRGTPTAFAQFLMLINYLCSLNINAHVSHNTLTGYIIFHHSGPDSERKFSSVAWKKYHYISMMIKTMHGNIPRNLVPVRMVFCLFWGWCEYFACDGKGSLSCYGLLL